MLTPEAEIRFVSHALFVTLTFSMLCSFFAGCPNTCLDRFSYHNLWNIRVCLTDTLKIWQSVTYCRGDKYGELLHDSVRSRYVTIIILTMALLCASSLLRARYPFCLLSSRRIATETGQVCLQFFFGLHSLNFRAAEANRPVQLSCWKWCQDGPFCWLFYAAIICRRRPEWGTSYYRLRNKSSILSVASHNHVRRDLGLFDVGHMVQSKYASDIVSVIPDVNSSA